MKIEKWLGKEWRNVLFNSAFGIASLVVVILFFENILLSSVLLGIIATIGLIKWRSKLTLVVFLVFSILFGIVEIIFVDSGAWQFGASNVGDIPFWLFILWGNAAAFIQQTVKEIRKLGIEK